MILINFRVLKNIAKPNELLVITGDDIQDDDYEDDYKKINFPTNSSDPPCQCCKEQIATEREARKLFQNKYEKEKKKLKEEKRKRKQLEKLLGASMQKQKATELRAQVAEEALKIYCPTHVRNYQFNISISLILINL